MVLTASRKRKICIRTNEQPTPNCSQTANTTVIQSKADARTLYYKNNLYELYNIYEFVVRLHGSMQGLITC